MVSGCQRLNRPSRIGGGSSPLATISQFDLSHGDLKHSCHIVDIQQFMPVAMPNLWNYLKHGLRICGTVCG
jgi:hypothetical protein